jgi:hypothetical protein
MEHDEQQKGTTVKLDMSAKSETEESKTVPGDYSDECLEEMLEAYVTAKKIESDPVLLAKLKDYAMSRNKMVEEMFDSSPTSESKEKPKSLADIKKMANNPR